MKTAYKGVSSLGDGKYLVRIQPLDPATGKRFSREKTVDAASPKEAAKLRMDFEEEVVAEAKARLLGAADRATHTLEEFTLAYLQTHSDRVNVRKRDTFRFKSLVFPILGQVKMSDLSIAHIRKWQTDAQQMTFTRRGKGKVAEHYSRATIEGAWAILRAMLRVAYVDGVIKDNVCPTEMRFTIKSALVKPIKEKESLSPEEVIALLKATLDASFDMRLMILVMVTTGMRHSEVAGLEWPAVDLGIRVFKVVKSADVGGSNMPKTQSSQRKIPIYPLVATMLAEHQTQQKKAGYTGPLVFPSRAGTHRQNAAVYKVLRKCCDAAGITKQFGTHTLRRTFVDATRLYADELVVRSIVGHATTDMFMHYSKVKMGEKAGAQQRALGPMLNPEEKS